jgi:hypothetical protein
MDEKYNANSGLDASHVPSKEFDVNYSDTLQTLKSTYKSLPSRRRGNYSSIEPTAFLEACAKLYRVSTKLFSEYNFKLLKKYEAFSTEIVVDLRKPYIKGLFENQPELTEHRLQILSVLHKHGIIQNINGKIIDQDWMLFLNKLDAERLEQYAEAFEKLDKMTHLNPEIFAQIKAHNDVSELNSDLENHALFNQEYDMPFTLSPDTQIKGFTLINEYVCKRTSSFPKQWKKAMKAAWETPSLEASFELYHLYSARQTWIDSFKSGVIRRFLNYLYQKPSFARFDDEPLTQACKLLYVEGLLNIDNFKLIADLTPAALAYIPLVHAKTILNQDYLDKIRGVEEPILTNINAAHAQRPFSSYTLDTLLSLAQKRIDGTMWIPYSPDWRMLTKLSDNSLRTLATSTLSEPLFSILNYFNEIDTIPLFNQLNEQQQKHLLSHVNAKKTILLLQHLEKIDLLTPENIQTIFDNETRLLKDTQLTQKILNLTKTNTAKDQKRLHLLMQDSTPKPRAESHSPIPSPESAEIILSALPDEVIAKSLSQKLKTLKIKIHEDELNAYSPAVLTAFHAVLPLLQEDNLLKQDNLKHLLRLFSSAPDPKTRSQCMIILSQCGLLAYDNYFNSIVKLETVIQENPALFREIYAEAWLQSDTSAKWLQDTIIAGFQEPEATSNAEETVIKRFFIDNEENSAYLALDTTKHRIARHSNPVLLQQTLKLVDQSKIKIERVFEDLVQTNSEQIQKIYYWLFILARADLLDANNAQQIITQSTLLPGDLAFLKSIVTAFKQQPDAKMSGLKQRTFEQLMHPDTKPQIKKKTLEAMQMAMQNLSPEMQFAYMMSDVVEESAVVMQAQLKTATEMTQKAAELLASTASDMTQKMYDKIKLFSNKPALGAKPTVPELLAYHSSIASQSPNFNHSYYQKNPAKLQEDLGALLSQGLLTEPNVKWLVQQPQQASMGRCLKILANANMLKTDANWQDKVDYLTTIDAKILDKLEMKCQQLLRTQESADNKIKTMQLWIEPLLQNQPSTPQNTRKQ